MSPAEMKRRAARAIVRARKPSAEKNTPEKENSAPTAVAVRVAGAGQVIVRSLEDGSRGTHPDNTVGYSIGYVVSGHKFIYQGDARWEASAGEVFFMNRGSHFVEELPTGGRKFEQIVFHYTSEQMSKALALLSVNYDLETCVNHSCDSCMRRDHVIATCWATLKQFFDFTSAQLRIGYYDKNQPAELLALANLVYHIVSQPEGCLRTRVMASADPEKELMERIIHEYIYSDMSLEELARRNNRSLSGFKTKFKEHFGEPPHRWVLRKRLMHARLMTIQTNKTTAQIAQECHFGNCSHFITLFREEYGLSPFQYRKKYRQKQ